ncbi:CRISPR-associated endonuclease Cas6 [Acetivibrio saccincola]|uniref:DNA repair protein n=1 Tax=Acetivibrio saccincola TaxID=1677857 RepID=A0A2S8RAJ4_9FIRM|nr:CRISPR-associated endonuclease Cas6 [Acetivibrio saccincola]NLI57531.1 CRISPR-associated endonuclease Cas6 [Clostridium sp.]PQQ66823.1 DNA repair protein [Acetivibrio saccincola]
MDIKMLTVKLEGNKVESRDIPKIRGYLAGRFPQYLELHNHIGENKFNYGYPVIQYKSIGGVPNIIAINEASKILIDIFYDVKEIDMKDKIMSILEKGYVLKTKEIGTAEGMVEYKFLTPWLALNQDNYERFANSGIDERTDILKKILTGNILSMAKGLGYWVEEPIEVLIKLNPVKINYKNRKMIGFKGGFMTNFMIPNHLGLGKSVARGFGTVKKVNGGFV